MKTHKVQSCWQQQTEGVKLDAALAANLKEIGYGDG